MSVRTILLHPDPILRLVAPVGTDLDTVGQLVADLTDTMRKHHALGLSAPQIGVSLRVCVVERSRCDRAPRAPQPWEKPLVLVNPILSGFSGKTTAMEGCLSLPGRQLRMRRSRQCFVESFSPEVGHVTRGWVHDFEARVVQHEVDHLDGILIIDQGSKVRHRPREVLA